MSLARSFLSNMWTCFLDYAAELLTSLWCWWELVLSSGLDLSPKMRPIISHIWAGPGFHERGGDGHWGDSFSHGIGAVVKPPKPPAVRETGQSKTAGFLISFLIPPDPIHPGPAWCNPPVRYPPMFSMLMPPTKWMIHGGTYACNHLKKDRCINAPGNPCLLSDNRLSINGAVNRWVFTERGIHF